MRKTRIETSQQYVFADVTDIARMLAEVLDIEAPESASIILEQVNTITGQTGPKLTVNSENQIRLHVEQTGNRNKVDELLREEAGKLNRAVIEKLEDGSVKVDLPNSF